MSLIGAGFRIRCPEGPGGGQFAADRLECAARDGVGDPPGRGQPPGLAVDSRAELVLGDRCHLAVRVSLGRARDALGADGHVVTLLLTMFAVGVGVGSMLCARLLHGEVSARLVPFAAFGITLFTWDFGAAVLGAGGLHLTDVDAVLHSPTGWRMLADLLLLSACGGLYSVPLYAIVQERSEPSHRARTIAANNIVNARHDGARRGLRRRVLGGWRVGTARAANRRGG